MPASSAIAKMSYEWYRSIKLEIEKLQRKKAKLIELFQMDAITKEELANC